MRLSQSPPLALRHDAGDIFVEAAARDMNKAVNAADLKGLKQGFHVDASGF